MTANYDNTASFYDPLSRLVFGKAQVNAQLFLLPHIKPNSRILIVGGGTGWILEDITRLHPSGLSIVYVEVSGPMMALSRKRNTGENEIDFIRQSIEEVKFDTQFDVIMTPFLFDNFRQAPAESVFKRINDTLTKDGLWLFTDLQLSGRWWQKPLLKMMYLFFAVLGRMDTYQLPDMMPCFIQYGYKKIAEKYFFGDFILSAAYQKA